MTESAIVLFCATAWRPGTTWWLPRIQGHELFELWFGEFLTSLLGGLEPWTFMTFHSVGSVIIPTDYSNIFQMGRAQPPTSSALGIFDAGPVRIDPVPMARPLLRRFRCRKGMFDLRRPKTASEIQEAVLNAFNCQSS